MLTFVLNKLIFFNRTDAFDQFSHRIYTISIVVKSYKKKLYKSEFVLVFWKSSEQTFVLLPYFLFCLNLYLEKTTGGIFTNNYGFKSALCVFIICVKKIHDDNPNICVLDICAKKIHDDESKHKKQIKFTNIVFNNCENDIHDAGNEKTKDLKHLLFLSLTSFSLHTEQFC